MTRTRKYGLSPTMDIKNTKILILGTFPSDESLESQEYYSNAKNMFWDTIAYCIGKELPKSYDEKIKMLSEKGICLWDLIESCYREGNLDKNIQDAVANNLDGYIKKNIPIFINGFSIRKKYNKYGHKRTILDSVILLPSTSSSNTRYRRILKECWKKELSKYLK